MRTPLHQSWGYVNFEYCAVRDKFWFQGSCGGRAACWDSLSCSMHEASDCNTPSLRIPRISLGDPKLPFEINLSVLCDEFRLPFNVWNGVEAKPCQRPMDRNVDWFGKLSDLRIRWVPIG
eukprot:3461987-Rhodomonas_salina.1